VRVGERLARDYPDNPRIQFTLAELYGSPAVEDPRRAADTYEAVMVREERRAGDPRPARFQARLGLASARMEQWRLDDAIGLLTPVIEARPPSPGWTMPAFVLRRANYRALQGDIRAARDDVARVLAEPAWKDQHKAATEMSGWIDRFTRTDEAMVFAALIAPNRLALEARWNEAAAAYDAVRARFPNHPQIRYRIAQMHFRKGEMQGLEQEFAAVAEAKDAPNWLRASALLQLGRVHDVAGHRADAKKTYERIVDEYGHESASWPAKVGLVSAYQRR
jgi:predicted Zn-dependent protease